MKKYIFISAILLSTTVGASEHFSNTYLDNDALGDKKDRWYTSGIVLRDSVFIEQNQLLDVSIGQQIFTPEKLNKSSYQPNDRPRTGWLYGGIGTTFIERESETLTVIDQINGQVGVTGKGSQASAVQQVVHNFTGGKTDINGPQQSTKIHANVSAKREWRFVEKFENIEVGFTPIVAATVGTLFQHVEVGAELRVGQNLVDNLISPFALDGVGKSGVDLNQDFNWAFHVGGRMRYVEANHLFDAPSGQSSAVTPRKWISEGFIGVSGGVPDFSVNYGYTVRSKEFEGQKEGQAYGSIGLNVKINL